MLERLLLWNHSDSDNSTSGFPISTCCLPTQTRQKPALCLSVMFSHVQKRHVIFFNYTTGKLSHTVSLIFTFACFIIVPQKDLVVGSNLKWHYWPLAFHTSIIRVILKNKHSRKNAAPLAHGATILIWVTWGSGILGDSLC